MTPDELTALINNLKAATADIAAKLQQHQAQTILTTQHQADLKATIESLVKLGKS